MRSVLLWANPTTAIRRAARKRSPRDQLGRREYRNRTTASPVTPFNVLSEHPRRPVHDAGDRAFVRLLPSGCAHGGLAGLFNNPTYGTIFSAFSPLRLFSPVGSNITEALFFVPGVQRRQ